MRAKDLREMLDALEAVAPDIEFYSFGFEMSGDIMYVQVEDRAEFDAIPLEMNSYEACDSLYCEKVDKNIKFLFVQPLSEEDDSGKAA